LSKKVTFDGAPAPGMINFGVGQPSADLLPVELMRVAADDFLRKAKPVELNYGERQGDIRFLETLAIFLSDEYGSTVTPDSLFVTAGNSQALDFICALFTEPGDTVFVEEPSYFLAFKIFADHGLNIVSIPVDEQGMMISRLEQELRQTRPKMLYTIPSFHNPGGQSMSAARRTRLVELSREYDFLIAADEVYQLLWYDQAPPAALGTMTEKGNIISLGSFSKILAPGLRLGWIQTSPDLMEQLLDSGAVNSGGSFNHFTSHIVRHALGLGLLQTLLKHLRQTYRNRVRAMDKALNDHVGQLANWHCPQGGYFFWLEFSRDVNTMELRRMAEKYQTGFQPGESFSSIGGLKNYMRLSFAHYQEADILEGVARLGRLLRDQIQA